MSRRGLAIAAALAALGVAAAPAAAQEPVGPYDGTIPFRCELQDVGSGTDFPDPDADPFCVEFDKTSQNVTDFGLVDFLLNEPARVAAVANSPAGLKCFYFQRDHWTGSIIQGSEPELWHWDGDYWYDLARGVGGVSVRNFRIGGVPFSAAAFAPPAYAPYFDENGGGGVEVLLELGGHPLCQAMVDTPEERSKIYRGTAHERTCVPPGGRLRGTKVGRVRLGMSRDRVLDLLGDPHKRKRKIDRWCVIGNAGLRIAYGRGALVGLVRTSSRGHVLRGVAPGDPARRAIRRFGKPEGVAGRTRVIDAGGGAKRHGYAGVRGRRVRWVAIADPALLPGAKAARALKRAR